MKNSKTKQVFEHTQLQIDEVVFKKSHWEALGYYNDKHGDKFFTLTPKGVKFNQYVGVVQVGNLTIEILPKIGQATEKEDKDKWQKVLIDMLRECSWMSIYTHEKAALRYKYNSILEAYLELFVLECEEIVRIGLIKKYRTVSNNCNALKGKLIFREQIQTNLIHKERFFTRHQTFDHEHVYNQILLKAIMLIPIISPSPLLKDRVYKLILSFPELSDISVNSETFQNLCFNRKTAHYKEAIEIAAMLLLNFRPDISSGKNHVLAILFDMNDLWEEFIYRQLYKSKPHDWKIQPQNSKKFWKLHTQNRAKTVRPDIVIHDQTLDKKIVIDTKWKIPFKNIPDDADLKQMFVYNEYWNGTHALLFYPNAVYSNEPVYYSGTFIKKENALSTHGCGIMKMAVLNMENTGLDLTIGIRINKFLKKKILI